MAVRLSPVITLVLWPSFAAYGQPTPARVTVSGEVIDRRSGAPLAEAGALLLLPDDKGKPTSRTLPVPHMSGVPTDARGKFAIEDVPEGKYFLTVSRSGYHPFSNLIDVALPRVSPQTVALTPFDQLTWRVLLPDGKPAAKATVFAAFQIGSAAPRNYKWTTDDQGACSTSFSAATNHTVLVRCPGAGSGCATVKTEVGKDAVAEVQLQADGTLTGQVREAAAGTPLAGRTVTVAPDGKPPEAVSILPYPPPAAKTDAQGNFSLAAVPAGSWQVQVTGDDVLNATSTPVNLAAGGVERVPAVEVAVAPRIDGTLLGVNGLPLSTVTTVPLVMEVRSDGKSDVFSATVPLLFNGELSVFARRLGETRVAASVPGEGYAVSPWLQVKAGSPIGVDLRMIPFATVRGVVRVTGDGQAVAGAQVTLTPVAASGAIAFGPLRTATDNGGGFVFPELMPGAYDLTAVAENLVLLQPLVVHVAAAGGALVEVGMAPPSTGDRLK